MPKETVTWKGQKMVLAAGQKLWYVKGLNLKVAALHASVSPDHLRQRLNFLICYWVSS